MKLTGQMDHKTLSSNFISLPWIQIPWRQFIRFLWLTRCHLSVVLTNATSFSQNSLMLLLTVFLTYVFLIGCLQEGVAKHRVQFPPYLPLERKNNVTYCVLWQYSKNLNKSFVHFWRASLKKFTTSSHKESVTWKGKKQSHNLFWCCEVTRTVFKKYRKGNEGKQKDFHKDSQIMEIINTRDVWDKGLLTISFNYFLPVKTALGSPWIK